MEREAEQRVPPLVDGPSLDSGPTAASRNDSLPQSLPDSASERVAARAALDWVGMRGIAMPVVFAVDPLQTSAASIGAWVDLADPNARGIHMSRIYSSLQARLANRRMDAEALRAVLDAMLASQSQLSRRALVEISADLLLLRPALVSALSGWQRYPLTLRARKSESVLSFELEWRVGYSSTCPSSAALARRAQADAFSARFGAGALDASAVAAWLAGPDGMVATAHAQRSQARMRMRWGEDCAWPDIAALIDRCEAALGTPLQTAVKRIDEQAFAVRNAENLMFCEDAARRLHAAFAHDAADDFDIHVAHFESLHAHDAVASVSRSGRYATLAVLGAY